MRRAARAASVRPGRGRRRSRRDRPRPPPAPRRAARASAANVGVVIAVVAAHGAEARAAPRSRSAGRRRRARRSRYRPHGNGSGSALESSAVRRSSASSADSSTSSPGAPTTTSPVAGVDDRDRQVRDEHAAGARARAGTGSGRRARARSWRVAVPDDEPVHRGEPERAEVAVGREVRRRARAITSSGRRLRATTASAAVQQVQRAGDRSRVARRGSVTAKNGGGRDRRRRSGRGARRARRASRRRPRALSVPTLIRRDPTRKVARVAQRCSAQLAHEPGGSDEQLGAGRAVARRRGPAPRRSRSSSPRAASCSTTAATSRRTVGGAASRTTSASSAAISSTDASPSQHRQTRVATGSSVWTASGAVDHRLAVEDHARRRRPAAAGPTAPSIAMPGRSRRGPAPGRSSTQPRSASRASSTSPLTSRKHDDCSTTVARSSRTRGPSSVEMERVLGQRRERRRGPQRLERRGRAALVARGDDDPRAARRRDRARADRVGRDEVLVAEERPQLRRGGPAPGRASAGPSERYFGYGDHDPGGRIDRDDLVGQVAEARPHERGDQRRLPRAHRPGQDDRPAVEHRGRRVDEHEVAASRRSPGGSPPTAGAGTRSTPPRVREQPDRRRGAPPTRAARLRVDEIESTCSAVPGDPHRRVEIGQVARPIAGVASRASSTSKPSSASRGVVAGPRVRVEQAPDLGARLSHARDGRDLVPDPARARIQRRCVRTPSSRRTRSYGSSGWSRARRSRSGPDSLRLLDLVQADEGEEERHDLTSLAGEDAEVRERRERVDEREHDADAVRDVRLAPRGPRDRQQASPTLGRMSYDEEARPRPTWRAPAPLCASHGNGRNSTVTVAYGRSRGVLTRTGVKTEPTSSLEVRPSASESCVLTVSWFSVSTPEELLRSAR